MKPSTEEKYRRLRKAVRRWIRAEYQYRLGPNAYHKPTDVWIVRAEENLRKSMTGFRTLRKAAKAVSSGKIK